MRAKSKNVKKIFLLGSALKRAGLWGFARHTVAKVNELCYSSRRKKTSGFPKVKHLYNRKEAKMKSVTLIASRTVDHINNLDKSTKLVRSGGPAFYCKQAIETLGCKVHLLTSRRPVTVHITIQDQHEKIRIDRIEKITLWGRLPTRNILLSPILGEFNLEQVAQWNCRVFLDAQGYIRAKGEDLTQRWVCVSQIVKNVVALKVNQRESSCVPEEILNLFRSRILLITRGQEGVEIWDHGKRYQVRGHPVEVADTLGAGDTFFGSFVAAYLQSGDAPSATRLAVQKAEQLLQRK